MDEGKQEVNKVKKDMAMQISDGRIMPDGNSLNLNDDEKNSSFRGDLSSFSQNMRMHE